MGEPRRPRRLVPFVAAAAVVVLVQTPAFAQAIDQYVSIVDQYANGDENGALNRLTPDGGGIPSAILARMRTLTDRQVRSAIMLHRELAAVLLANARAPRATAQIGNAQRPLEIPTEDTRRRTAARPFAITSRPRTSSARSQTSAVALGRVELAMGHADRAGAITAAFAQPQDRAEDPWWNYQLGGFEPGAITWLRTEARRQ